MEEDRAQVDLGKATETEIDVEIREKPKQPKKRFIGRKAAAVSAERNGLPYRDVEASDAVQGSFHLMWSSEFLVSNLYEQSHNPEEPLEL